MKYEATLLVHVSADLDDEESTEDTLRYLVEQDLEDAGFDVEVSVVKNNEV